MVVDTLENLEKYASLNPLFAQAIEFLKSHDLQAMEIGKTELKGKDLLTATTRPLRQTRMEKSLLRACVSVNTPCPKSATRLPQDISFLPTNRQPSKQTLLRLLKCTTSSGIRQKQAMTLIWACG